MPEARRIAGQQTSDLPYPDLRVQTAPANKPQEPASEDYNCPICLDLLLEPVVGACGHEFCKECYTRWLARSRGFPSCPLCRKVLAVTVPGVSRRLAELIEATFPEGIKDRRLTRERDIAAESASASLLGQTSHSNVLAPADELPPALEPASLWAGEDRVIRHLRQSLFSSNRPDSPYPGLEDYPGAAAFREHTPYPSVTHEYRLHDESDSPVSSSDPGSLAEDEPYLYEGSPPMALGSPPRFPTSPAFHPGDSSASLGQSPRSPLYHSGSTNSPPGDRPGYAQLLPGIERRYPRHLDSSRYERSPSQLSLGASPPSSPGYSATPPFQLAPPPFPPRGYAPLTTFQVVDVPRQYRDTTLAAATPTALNDPHSRGAAEDGDDRRTTAARAATGTAGIAGTSMGGQYWPQPYTGPYGDFSRLLHSTDQLAQQLESAYARMSYLTQYAGQSYAGHANGVQHPPSLAAQYYSGYTEIMRPWVGYVHPAPPALHPSVPLASCPWLSASGLHPAPAPTGTSFAQSMPPPGTLPFTMGSEPRAAPRSSRRAAMAMTAMNPARYRGRTRGRGARALR